LAADQARSARDKHTLGHTISAPADGLAASAPAGRPGASQVGCRFNYVLNYL
jgi:hypothetical protein